MNNYREIKKIVTGSNTIDGAGVNLVRVFGNNDVKEFDPFLLLDGFDSTDPTDYVNGFPWHPHRGIETITYLIQGNIDHWDSLGNKGSILSEDCQWMTAGSGIIHQEMPKPSERMLGAQIWLNLPSEHKMCSPAYGDITHKDIPTITINNTVVKIIAGEYLEIPGAFKGNYVDATYLDIQIGANTTWEFISKESETLFVYIFQGGGVFGPDKINSKNEDYIKEKHAVLFTQGKILQVKSNDMGLRFILLSAKPLNEPIAWGGPIVMNTKKDLEIAFQELRNNTFIKE